MKFGDKLFLIMTAVLTVIFTIFGTWMLTSYFQQLLNREIEQVSTEGQMFQYLYEMAYQSMQDYGSEYAVTRAVESVADRVEKEGVSCFAVSGDNTLLYGSLPVEEEEFLAVYQGILEDLETPNTYICEIRRMGTGYYLINICGSSISGGQQYLGICRDLSSIYEDRNSLMNQYKLSLVLLLFVGGICIFVMSRVMSRPIMSLSKVAGKIASGNYELRSDYGAPDEIGELAVNFNRMADRLVEQMQEKELEARQKEDFNAAFAHELKTPLTSIIGYADMLNTMELTEEERREAYYYIYSQGKRLESLSHKLLELVSLNKTTLVRKPVATRQLEEDIRNTMRPVFRKKGVKGRIDMEKAVLYGDRELLLSLFYNLLDNACKAVGAGGFVLLKGRKAGNGYEIKVVDNGRGIPKEEISRITEAFYMVDKSRSRKEGGAGIGLSLCKQIVDRHGGVMEIVSKPGEGTVFRLIFPRMRERDQSVPEENAAGNESRQDRAENAAGEVSKQSAGVPGETDERGSTEHGKG